MSPFSSFAFAFSLISVFTGVFANFGHGLRHVGGAIVWSWLVVLVGLGVLLLSRLQGNEADEAAEFMRRVSLRHQPKDLEISRADLEASLANLRAYVERRGDLWWTVINEREITGARVRAVLDELEF